MRIPSTFQSSLPRGERPLRLHHWPSFSGNFNPRSHEGSDNVKVFQFLDSFCISILAPTRGATPLADKLIFVLLFQSSLPRGERPEPVAPVQPELTISILAPTRGATFPSILVPLFSVNFNPRSHEGSD